jgi:ethanolamine utilization protein EutQ (cupin superfamily)
MSVQHLTIDDTRAWFQAGDHDVYVGDVLDVITSPSTRVRFARYGKGAMHEWMVTVDETLIVTRGALMVRSAGQVQIARAGEVISLTKGTLVVYRGEEAETEVVFVSYAPRADVQRVLRRVEELRPPRNAMRLTPTFTVAADKLKKGA